MQLRTLVLLASAAGVFGAPRHTLGQVEGFAVNRFEPSARGSDWFVNDSLDLRGSANVAAGAVFDWAYQPLVLYESGDADGRSLGDVLTDQVVVHPGASVMVDDRYRLAVSLPVVLYQRGDEEVRQFSQAASAPEGAGLGDLRLSADLRLIGRYGEVFTAAAGLQVHVPTGKRSALASDETFRFTPRVLVAGDGAGLVYAAKLGFAYRPLDEVFEGLQLGSEAVFSVAGGVRVNDVFVFGPELYGSTVVTNGAKPFAQRGTPLELLLGLHVTLAEHWQLGSGLGPGFTRADGTPSMRVVLSIEFAPDVCVDPDGDGVCAPRDACPDVTGVRTWQRSINGCPADRDQDGISDDVDACGERAGVRSDEPSKNGCPAGRKEEPPEPPKPK
jgi:OmpA-OmpF porin, OOP family